MEEKVLKISEVIKGLCRRIEDLQLCSIPRTPPNERERRERTMLIAVANIKKVEE